MSGNRSTIREIPIQREYNPFGVSQSSASTMSALPHHGATTTAWSNITRDPITGNPQHEEYYRKEVTFYCFSIIIVDLKFYTLNLR